MIVILIGACIIFVTLIGLAATIVLYSALKASAVNE